MKTLSEITTTPRLLLLLVLAAQLTGCSFLYRNTVGLFSSDSQSTVDSPVSKEKSPFTSEEPPAREMSRVGVEKLERESEKHPSVGEIEIVWEVPSDPVEGFVIHYGYSKDQLDQSVRVRSGSIEKYEDPRYGFVYRHKISGIPLDATVFVSMATYNGTDVSKQSQVFEVAPSTSSQ